ncbi:MAG: family efflux transporter [Alphaproteobacteria bacterium]|nr:family efflux transporter [Alphaproteobacteria bacterium]
MRYNRPERSGEIGAEARRILRLAWPIMLTSLNWTLMHLIDVAMVGHAGTTELGALAASRTLTFITIVMGLASLSGVLVFTARADGARHLAETGDILRSGVLMGLVVGLLCLALLIGAPEPMLRAIGVAPELVGPGAAVVRAMALAYPFQFALAAGSYFLEGISRPRRVMTVNLAMLLVNAVLAWAWVGGHLGFPARGAVGAALATATVSAIGAAAMLVCCWFLPHAEERRVRDVSRAAIARAVAGVPRLAWFGLVPAIGAALELAGFSWLIALSTQLGVITAAAFQAMLSIHNLVFALAMGFASAAGVRVGNAVGEGDVAAAGPRTMIAALLAVVVLGTLATVFALSARWLMLPFSEDPSVLALSARMVVLMAPFMLFDGVQYVLSYALRSLGEQVWAGLNGIIGFFLITGGLGWWLVRSGWGGDGLVYAGGAGMVAVALLHLGRLVIVLRRRFRSAG